MADLKGRAALVTGSSRGIGAAIAFRLAADGFPVVVNFREDEAGANGTVESIIAKSGNAIAIKADVRDDAQVRAMFAVAVERFGGVTVLVNNASGPIAPKALDETKWEDLSDQLMTHLKGSFSCAQAAIPIMRGAGAGRIVNITSIAATGVPPARQAAYVIAKSALAALTRTLALDLGPSGITVNSVAPGLVDTALVADVPERARLSLAAQAPLRRLAEAADVADIVSFLVGSGGRHITGQTVNVSGGEVMP